MRLGGLAIALTTVATLAFAQGYPYPDEPRAAAPPPAPAMFLADLPGWAADDHVAALSAVESACSITRDKDMREICAAIPNYPSDSEAKAFLEANFTAEPAGADGRLTGYFMPVYDARTERSREFDAPVRPRPADLPPGDLSSAGRAVYASRKAIEKRHAADALAWMRPEDLFFMQVQGAGVLAFPDGTRAKAVFAGSNGAPFVGVANPMRAQGLLADQDTSADAIHTWLADHRGAEADRIIDLDPRYIFYSLTDDDGLNPFGSAGSRLVAGRAVAVDPTFHAMGDLLWVDGDAPILAGAFPTYRRLVVALDTGGAIKGQARADLYVGRGPVAGAEAGRIRHTLNLYRLVPRREP